MDELSDYSDDHKASILRGLAQEPTYDMTRLNARVCRLRQTKAYRRTRFWNGGNIMEIRSPIKATRPVVVFRGWVAVTFVIIGAFAWLAWIAAYIMSVVGR